MNNDFVQAIEFVSMQHDDELWEELIQQCLHKPEMVKDGHKAQIKCTRELISTFSCSF